MGEYIMYNTSYKIGCKIIRIQECRQIVEHAGGKIEFYSC